MDVKALRHQARIGVSWFVSWFETWIQQGGSVLLDLKLTLKKKQGRERESKRERKGKTA